MTQMHCFDLLVLLIHFLHMQGPACDEDIGILASMSIVKPIWGQAECLLCANFRFITNIKFYVKLK